MHDETCVDGQDATTGFNFVCVSMATDAGLFFEQLYFMFLAEQVRGPHPCNPSSDHRDPAHRASLSDSGSRMPRRSLATPSQFNSLRA